MRTCVLGIATASALAACHVAPIQTKTAVPIKAPFDADQARRALEPGTGTLAGSALMRQAGGGVVSCAGGDVYLIPATAYAKERLEWFYVMNPNGSGHASLRNTARFEPDPPLYSSLTRATKCDAQGAFEFDRVAAGEYYVITQIVWAVGRYPSMEGGNLLQRVQVSDGQRQRVVLSP